ncbi:MAG: class I SAM-dependent RNA methyltransferase [Pyrinomonadaceae bacterium]|nr:class I SAM-dependent RNA methyltransferase [Pyrinomonadaceae bacterium]MCX7640253.1 class I SAM-dependent RNA methyltransferase [Pyrinomonadaceae bacterium]
MTEILELTIEKIVPGGYGLGHANGFAVFVPLTAVGDKVRAKVVKKSEKFYKAELVEIIEASPFRQKPRCQYFGNCGGCDFQHLKYEFQLKAKVGVIYDCLRRIAGINYENEIQVIPSYEFEYRLRAEWHVRDGRIGYFRYNSNHLVEIEHCSILAPRLQELLTDLRYGKKYEGIEKTEIEVITDGDKTSVFSALEKEPSDVELTIGKERYLVNARLFFQANRYLLVDMLDRTVGDAGGERCLDLYCGVGFFTLPLARRFKEVYAVEQAGEAIGYARRNAEMAGLKNIKFFAQKVSSFLDRSLPELDLVLLDPPRTGAEGRVIEKIIFLEPAEIYYVSCDPATLARDLKKLVKKYGIYSITAIDLFPQTHHIETIVKLRRI